MKPKQSVNDGEIFNQKGDKNITQSDHEIPKRYIVETQGRTHDTLISLIVTMKGEIYK